VKMETETAMNVEDLKRNLKDALLNLASEKSKSEKFTKLYETSQRDLDTSQEELAKTKISAANSNAELTRLKKRVEDLEKELDGLINLVKDKDSILSKKDIELAAAVRNVEKIGNQCSKAEAELKSADDLLKKKSAAFDVTSAKLVKAEGELAEGRDNLKKVSEDLGRSIDEIKSLKSLVSSLENDIKMLNDKLSVRQEELAVKIKSEESLLAQNFALGTDLKKVGDACTKFESKVNLLEGQLKSADADVNAAKIALAAKSKEFAQVDAERIDYKARYGSILERSAALEKENATLNDTIQNFKGQISGLRSEMDEKLGVARKTIDEYRLKLDSQSAQLNGVADELTLTKRAKMNADEALGNVTYSLNTKEAEVSDLNRDLDSAKVEISKLRQELSEVQMMCDSKNNELLEARHTMSNLTVTNETLRQSAETSERARIAAIDELASTSKRIDALSAEYKSLSTSIDEKSKEVILLEAEIKALTEELKIKDGRLQAYTKAITQFEQEITILKGTVAKNTSDAVESQRNFKSELDGITKKLVDESAALAAQITRLAVAQETILNLTKANEGLSSDMKAMEKKMVAKDQEVLNARDSLVRCESELKSTIDLAKSLKEKVFELTGASEQQKAHLVDISARNIDLEKENFTQKKTIDDLQSALARESATADVKFSDLKSALDAALRDWKAEKAANDLLLEKLNALVSQGNIIELEEKLRAANDNLQLSAAEVTLKAGKISQCEDQLQVISAGSTRKDKIIADLEAALADLKKKNATFSASADKLKEDLKLSRQSADELKNGDNYI